jgi:hypothetical protein
LPRLQPFNWLDSPTSVTIRRWVEKKWCGGSGPTIAANEQNLYKIYIDLIN